jgi:hypothetical protein
MQKLPDSGGVGLQMHIHDAMPAAHCSWHKGKRCCSACLHNVTILASYMCDVQPSDTQLRAVERHPHALPTCTQAERIRDVLRHPDTSSACQCEDWWWPQTRTAVTDWHEKVDTQPSKALTPGAAPLRHRVRLIDDESLQQAIKHELHDRALPSCNGAENLLGPPLWVLRLDQLLWRVVGEAQSIACGHFRLHATGWERRLLVRECTPAVRWCCLSTATVVTATGALPFPFVIAKPPERCTREVVHCDHTTAHCIERSHLCLDEGTQWRQDHCHTSAMQAGRQKH